MEGCPCLRTIQMCKQLLKIHELYNKHAPSVIATVALNRELRSFSSFVEVGLCGCGQIYVRPTSRIWPEKELGEKWLLMRSRGFYNDWSLRLEPLVKHNAAFAARWKHLRVWRGYKDQL